MLVLEIIAVVVAIVAIVAGLYSFNLYCEERFSHRFLTKIAFFLIAASMTLLYVGYRWRVWAATSGGDTLNGMILIALGCLMVIGLAFYNYKSTNILYCIIGTSLQIALFGALAYFGFFVMILGIALAALFGASTSRGSVITYIDRV